MSALDTDLARLERDQLVELALDDLKGLLCEPDADPYMPRRGPYRTGLEDLALTLNAAEHLPDKLTVRVVLPPATSPEVPTATAQAALQQRASDLASVSWREAMAVRSMGRRQLPIGLLVAVVAVFLAYGAVYLASGVDNLAGKGILVVLAGIAITVAWVTSWMVVESADFDWRQSAREAHVYELLALRHARGRDRAAPHRLSGHRSTDSVRIASLPSGHIVADSANERLPAPTSPRPGLERTSSTVRSWTSRWKASMSPS